MHFNNIKLYINWVKPYLKAVRQLQSASTEGRPYIASTFESSESDLEIMAVGKSYKVTTEEGYEETFEFQKYRPCVIIKFHHLALPQMSFQKEFQRGPIHTGRTEVNIKGYALTEEQIKEYQAARDRETFEEVSDLVPSLTDSLNALGDELQKYLKEAGETVEEKQEPKSKKQPDTIFTPFTSLFKGFGLFKKEKTSEKPVLTHAKENIELNAAKGTAKAHAFILYDVYKKSHGMLTP